MKRILSYGVPVAILLALMLFSCDSLPDNINNNDGTLTITFHSDDGTVIAVIHLENGDVITEPDEPTKDLHNFIGWYKDPELTDPWDFENDTIAESIFLYAKWLKTHVLVSFQSNGGSSVANQNLEPGEKVEEPDDPNLKLHNFLGWYANSDLTVLWDFDDTVLDDMTLYAKWLKVLNQISYHPNGGGGEIEPDAGMKNEFVWLSSNTDNFFNPLFTFTDYEFVKWNTEPDGSGIYYKKGQSYKVGDDDIVLYAQWAPLSYVNAYQLGEVGPSGGHIFYIDVDHEFFPEWRYLEAAPSSAEPSEKLVWAFTTVNIDDAKKEHIGDGISNTTAIVEKHGEPSDDPYAAYYCDTYISGIDTSNWFLPSKRELARMCQVLHYNGVGNFENGSGVYYWSSTQGINTPSTITGEGRAYVVRFDLEDHNSGKSAIATATTWAKGSKAYVRPIRAF